MSWVRGTGRGPERVFDRWGGHMVYTLIWEFHVAPERTGAFELAYAPDGPWTRLFARSSGYIATKLLKCAERQGRYLTVDIWHTPAAFESFKQDFGEAYVALDGALARLAEAEIQIGAFSD